MRTVVRYFLLILMVISTIDLAWRVWSDHQGVPWSYYGIWACLIFNFINLTMTSERGPT